MSRTIESTIDRACSRTTNDIGVVRGSRFSVQCGRMRSTSKYTGPVSSMGNAVTRPSSAAFSFGASDRDSSSRKGFPPSKQQKQNSSHSALRPQTSTDQARLSLQPCQPLCTQAPQPQSTLVSSTPRPQTTPSHKSLKYTWLRGSVSSRRPFRGALFRILMRKPLLWTGTSNSFSSNSLSTYA